MKHLSLVALLATSSLFAATDAQVIAYFKAQVPDHISVTIENRKAVDKLKGYDIVTTKLSDGTQSQVITLFTKDGLMFPDIIDLDSGVSMKESIEQAQLQQKIGAIYKSEKKNNIVALGNDKNKPTMVVFSDPECPYCRNELGTVEERLKTHNLRLILTPVHDTSALQKSYLIYQGVAKAKDDAAKIAILRKYFDEAATVDATVSEDGVMQMDQLRRKYLQAGLKGVPFYIEEKELLQ